MPNGLDDRPLTIGCHMQTNWPGQTTSRLFRRHEIEPLPAVAANCQIVWELSPFIVGRNHPVNLKERFGE